LGETLAGDGTVLAKIVVVAVAVAFVSGCSVYMATQGSHKPDLSALDEGAKRNRVETALGQPIKSQRDENDYRIDTYRYENWQRAECQPCS